MTTTDASVGLPAGGRPINLAQLQSEIQAQGVALNGLGMHDDPDGPGTVWIYPYDQDGVPTNFTPQDTPIVQQAINNHVGMRNKTDAEYAEEFQNPDTTPARKQEIRDITAGLLPAEQVPITQAEWDAQYV